MEITFQDFDKFGRKSFADRLTSVISLFSPFYDEAFVLSLNAKYGAGKTTFLKMWENQLQGEGYKVIYINAWETDFDDEPLIPIVSALLDNIGGGSSFESLKTVLQGTLGAFALASNNVLSHAIGLNIKEMIEEVEADLRSYNIQSVGEELYKEFSYKKDAYKKLKDELHKYVQTLDKKPLVVFVDELDRVRPDYAVRFLEAIKHLFSLKGICFVLAVDRGQLKASVKQLYGEIDFENYYLRFVTRETDLPEIDKINLKDFVKHQGVKFFDEKQKNQLNFPFEDKDKPKFLNFIEVISKVFRFSPRQIESLFRYFSQIMAVSKSDRAAQTAWIEAAIILCALFISNRDVYRKIGNGTMPVTELYEYFKGLKYEHLPRGDGERSILIRVLAFYMRNQQEISGELANVMLQYEGKLNKDAENYETLKSETIGHLAGMTDSWGHIYDHSLFQKIYSIIEEWREFIE